MTSFFHAAREIAGACPAMRVRAASRMMTRTFDEALRPLGLQMSQLSMLIAVAMFGETGAGIGALARSLVMDRTTVTRNLQALQKGGLVAVARSPADGRARVVVLSRAGERMIESAHPLWRQAHERLRHSLGADRMDELHSELGELVGLAPLLDDPEPASVRAATEPAAAS